MATPQGPESVVPALIWAHADEALTLEDEAARMSAGALRNQMLDLLRVELDHPQEQRLLPGVDAGGKLPLILTFVDTADHVDSVLPKVKEMAGHRLIIRENVTVEAGEFE